ncbi:MAG: exo-alpha-sialidase [Deferribacteres bacterium]|nr:exo-alpha-sialidase [candidate division KSB1 bacterium]MCB9500903.1 exo-alpha-sialidase [Deferribacteres bacterium]
MFILLHVGCSKIPDHSKVPGVVISHSPASSGRYIGSPSIAVLPNGDYVASHDFFGPEANHKVSPISLVFASSDRGETWKQIAKIEPLFWGKLFVHNSALYMLGTRHEYGDVLIRRSDDGGHTWTTPDSPETGVLKVGPYHCAPCRVVVDNDRIWRSFELAEGSRPEWSAIVISAPVDADLLNASSWTFTEPYQHLWSESQWIEGNVVLTPEGKLVNILRTNRQGDDRAAITWVAEDGKTLSHDRDKDLIDMPGGGVKFTIRFDEQTGRYWAVVSKQTNPEAYRNNLVLISSDNLRDWQVESPLLFHEDSEKHAWQYVDWLFDGNDIIFVSRTAFDDGLGGAYKAHDANYLTFHRIANFRTREPGPLQ